MDKTRQGQIDLLNKLIPYTTDAVAHAKAVVEELGQKIADLDGKTCTGSVSWRDKDHETRDAKMQALHGKDVTCPIHGKPKNKGGRLRSYVGSDPDKMEEMREAMRLHGVRNELLQARTHARTRLSNAEEHLRKFFTNLGWRIDAITNEPEVIADRMTESAWATRRSW